MNLHRYLVLIRAWLRDARDSLRKRVMQLLSDTSSFLLLRRVSQRVPGRVRNRESQSRLFHSSTSNIEP